MSLLLCSMDRMWPKLALTTHAREWRNPVSEPGILGDSNGNASETKANESFDNGVFFDIEAKRTPSIVSKLFSKRSEHIR